MSERSTTSVELVVHGDTALEIQTKATVALVAFFGTDIDYTCTIRARAIALNDGTVMGYQAEVEAWSP